MFRICDTAAAKGNSFGQKYFDFRDLCTNAGQMKNIVSVL
jgi:hypothetical protein